jgi:hypothetical protein
MSGSAAELGLRASVPGPRAPLATVPIVAQHVHDRGSELDPAAAPGAGIGLLSLAAVPRIGFGQAEIAERLERLKETIGGIERGRLGRREYCGYADRSTSGQVKRIGTARDVWSGDVLKSLRTRPANNVETRPSRPVPHMHNTATWTKRGLPYEEEAWGLVLAAQLRRSNR